MAALSGWLMGRGMRVLDRGRSNGRFGLKEWTILFGMVATLHGTKRVVWIQEVSVTVLVIGGVLMLVIAGWVSELFNVHD
ncbi:hypothetical protein CDL60_24705 [Roseateles noduli]|nr:hypothetical protein CDL60_24705 [Roseateles noduli]